jgi:hypothetical protein
VLLFGTEEWAMLFEKTNLRIKEMLITNYSSEKLVG